MPFPTDNPMEWIEHLKSIGSLVEGCAQCGEQAVYILKHNRMEFAPRHKASDSCESGKRPHCTCDRCF